MRLGLRQDAKCMSLTPQVQARGLSHLHDTSKQDFGSASPRRGLSIWLISRFSSNLLALRHLVMTNPIEANLGRIVRVIHDTREARDHNIFVGLEADATWRAGGDSSDGVAVHHIVRLARKLQRDELARWAGRMQVIPRVPPIAVVLQRRGQPPACRVIQPELKMHHEPSPQQPTLSHLKDAP